MARIAKSAAAAPAASKAVAAGKVAKLDKTAKTTKSAKPAPAADTEATPAKPRGQYAVGKLKVTAEGKTATLRGGRAVRLDLVRSLDGKAMADVIGASYQLEGEAEARTLNSGNIAVFIEKGLIEIV